MANPMKKTPTAIGNPFQPVDNSKPSYARMALVGPSGGGKTVTALRIASPFEKVAVVCTEHDTARKYHSKTFGKDSKPLAFDVMSISGPDASYSTEALEQAIQGAIANDYQVLIVDSFSHFWESQGGILDMTDQLKGGDPAKTRDAWAETSPLWRKQIHLLMSAPLHLIVTMRAKTNWVVKTAEDGQGGKVQVIGTTPAQRKGIEYEFDLVGYLQAGEQYSTLSINKTRCSELSYKTFRDAGSEDLRPYFEWLGFPSPKGN